MESGKDLVEELDRLESEALGALEAASAEDELEEIRIEYLGRSDGKVSSILRKLGELDADARPRVGAAANRVKAAVVEALEGKRKALASARGSEESSVDLTLPSRREWAGGRHPVTRVVDEICRIFASLGFTRARGREAETDWYNFEALNTPLDHPAADEQDTLYLGPGILLRSHTSPVQIRTMEAYDPPIRILAPGMVFRRDTADATHTPAFMQIEGLAVDEGITFVDLKATLAEFARRFFGSETEVRFRPSFFPFTEPSAEVDVKRVTIREDGTVEEGEWLEIMGAGMVDPAVLEAVGYDSERYSGFAFGMGPARIASLRYQIPDIRSFFENDVRFLRQFA